ncbi:hypothetical protein B9Z55_021022 [Caenorhabditis nigoni]|nr:hypothetical protein B9Z55_021022 [Caenorhabditis nigoni]
MDSKFAFPEDAEEPAEPTNHPPEFLSRAPTSFDARDHWPNCNSIKMIRDQAYCGSCWAFGAAEVISDRICIQSNGTDQPIISPEDILTCCTNSHGCQGGFVLEAMKFWKSNGVVTGGDFQGDGCIPYSYGSCSDCHTAQTTPKCKNTCQEKYTKNEYKEDKYYGSSAYRLSTSNAVRTIQNEILRNGPVEATYQVYEDFYYYKSGVYEYVSGKLMGGHAVKIIGWGVEENVDYWLIANSWGTELSTTTQTSLATPQPEKCPKRVVGYFNGWESREISPSQLSKLSHVIYCCLGFDANQTHFLDNIPSKRRFSDVRNHARASNTGVKVMAGIGGTHYSQYFPQVAAENREFFVNSTVQFIKDYQIDGVDLYWHEPDSLGGDKENYVLLVRDLRLKLTELQISQNRTTPYLLTVLTPSFGWYLEDGVDLPGLSEYVDFFNVASDDYTDSSSEALGAYTKPHAPLYSGSGDKPKQNVDWTMRYYTCNTKQPEKVNMGLPFFGRYWMNVLDPIAKNNEVWRRVKTVEGVAEKGLVLWKNVVRDGWNISNIKWDQKSKSSYIWDPENKWFLGIDDEQSLKEKINYVKDKNLGGVMIWSIDMDDYSETLLNAVASVNMCSEAEDDNKLKYNC